MSPSKKSKRSPKRIKSPSGTHETQRKNRKNPAPVSLPEVQAGTDWKTVGLRVLALLAAVGITIYVYLIRDHVRQFAALGYPGVFMVALLANATVFVPAPGLAIIYAMGSIFNPLAVGLAAGTGGAFGELSGYLAGYSGQAVVERTDIYERIHPWVIKYGGWAILFLAAIPNPFFDIAGVAAGITKMPMWRFLLFCWVGQLIKMTVFAYAGMYSIEWIANYFQ